MFQAWESGQGTDETGLTFQRPPPRNDLLFFPNIINHLHFYSGSYCFIGLRGAIHNEPFQHCSRASEVDILKTRGPL